MPAAFVLLLHRRFRDVEDRREVTRFVLGYNAAAPPTQRVPPRQAEAVLRANLGEAHLAELVDDVATARIMYALLFALVDDLALSEDEIDDLITAADDLLHSVMKSSQPDLAVPTIDLATVIPHDSMQWRPTRLGQGAEVNTGSGSM
ncbi:hypothetical protein ACIBVK_27865 [Micromonospora echinofusca]|uniref:hypothetical protein n=1 Tax=Micromonospora echinofusca TaxID=47858 RepID=UPI003798648A